MDYIITSVEDSASFPKQFSDRRSVHGFGGGDASKLTDKDDNRETDHTQFFINNSVNFS